MHPKLIRKTNLFWKSIKWLSPTKWRKCGDYSSRLKSWILPSIDGRSMEMYLLHTKCHSNTNTPYHPRELNIQRPSLPFCPLPFLFSLQSCSGRLPAQQAFATSAAWVFSSMTPSRFLGSSARSHLLAAPISSPPSAAAFSLYVPPSKCLCLLGLKKKIPRCVADVVGLC